MSRCDQFDWVCSANRTHPKYTPLINSHLDNETMFVFYTFRCISVNKNFLKKFA